MSATKKLELTRYHVFTDKGRKIIWAETMYEARLNAEKHGLIVLRIACAPNPLEDARLAFIANDAGISLKTARKALEDDNLRQG